jgi:hypothetical protein
MTGDTMIEIAPDAVDPEPAAPRSLPSLEETTAKPRNT